MICVVLAVLLTLAVAALVIGHLAVCDKHGNGGDEGEGYTQDEEQGEEEELGAGVFTLGYNGDWYGVVRVEGYATVKQMANCFQFTAICLEEGVEVVDYVVFTVLRSGNEEFLRLVETGALGGGVVAGGVAGGVGLGCFADGVLSYFNTSDRYGRVSFSMSQSDTARLMGSSRDNPITLELERLPVSAGMTMPACYSQITTIRVL